jgi:hypothetical protein
LHGLVPEQRGSVYKMKYLRVSKDQMRVDDRIRELVWPDKPMNQVFGSWFLIPETHPNITALALIIVDPDWQTYEAVHGHAKPNVVSFV